MARLLGESSDERRQSDGAVPAAEFRQARIEITVDDPTAYTAAWTIKLNQPIVLDTELLDYICAENERDSPHFTAK